MAKFTLAEILGATGGELRQFPGNTEASDASEFELTGISTDTRTIEDTQWEKYPASTVILP